MKLLIIENAIDGEYLDVEYAVEVAEMLRNERIEKAIKFLTHIECYGICEEIREFSQSNERIEKPAYQHLTDLETELRTPRNVEKIRFFHSLLRTFNHFLKHSCQLLIEFHRH